jgi:hypothetical protein
LQQQQPVIHHYCIGNNKEIKYCGNLKSVSLCASSISVIQLINYISPQFDTLTMDIDGRNFDVWAHESGAHVLETLGCLLGSIKNFSISIGNKSYWHSGGQYQKPASSNFDDLQKSRLRNYRSIIKSIYKKRSSSIVHQFNVVMVRNSDRLTNEVFTVAARNGKLHVDCRFIVTEDTIAADLSYLLGSTAEAPQNSNKQMMPVIYSMDVKLQHHFGSQTSTIFAATLETVLASCHHLTNLSIQVLPNYDYEENGPCRFKSELFDLLNNDNYALSSKRYERFIEDSSPIVDYLTHSTLQGFHISSPMLQDIIGNSLYNIEIFGCSSLCMVVEF